ncbi:hypothetical protein HOLleu_42139 [Holothuria leucospilota]|uniref:Uncharacterized protein n=1 Tax=Holothuria leucospilota TaxID=206669 RepID=A0A9Q1BCB0_HOLLE|nr:hypothetical protein HOLleu_42139 [Holothuria leucospilota]
MISNLLVLNSDETKVIHFSSRHKKVVEIIKSLRNGRPVVTPSSCVRDLGVYVKFSGNFGVYINHICVSIYFAPHRMGKISTVLDQSQTEKLVHALITSKFDYCNSVHYG